MAAPIPASRAASLLLVVGSLNLVITLFVALVAARGWNRLPELGAEVRLVDASGAEAGRLEWRAPEQLAQLDESGARARLDLPDGARLELTVPRAGLERVAGAANLLKLFQLAIPLLVSVLFLAAGLRLRRLARAG